MAKRVGKARDILAHVLLGSARPSFDWFRLFLSKKKTVFRLCDLKRILTASRLADTVYLFQA